MKKFNVGDKVWWANCGMREVRKPCPICFGNRQVELILGNGEHLVLPCKYCGMGYEGPRGYIIEYEYVAEPEMVTIDNVSIEQTCIGKEKREYRNRHRCLDLDRIFVTKEEALEECKSIRKRLEEEQRTKAKYIKADVSKSYAWNAGYHMRMAKKARKDAAYHDEKAKLCKERIPENT